MKGHPRVLLLAVVILVTAGVFWLDLLTPVGIEVWVFYLPVILAPVWVNDSYTLLATSLLCSVLVILGSFISPVDYYSPWSDWLNRGMGLLAIWLTTFTGLIICHRSIRLAEVMRRLQREIAEHNQTEQALRESQERLRLAVDGAGMGTWDLNLRTGVLVASDTYLRMLGYDPGQDPEITRAKWWASLHPDDQDRVLAAEDEARRMGTLYCVEYRIRRADPSETIWLAVFGRFLYADSGVAVRFVGVSFDITRRKELEREVLEIAAREQQHIGQELHDGVGQELTGLGLMANALVQRLDEAPTELQIATRLVAGIERVHKQVRSLSRGLIPVEVEARGLAAALAELASSTSGQSGIPVTFNWTEWVRGPDLTTATQLFRIAQEALSNALRHGMPQHIALRLTTGPSGLELGIEDDGVGLCLPPKGSKGMGLRIMHYRAEQIGAVLRIGPGEQGGTVVTCTLPRRSEYEAKPELRDGTDPNPGRR